MHEFYQGMHGKKIEGAFFRFTGPIEFLVFFVYTPIQCGGSPRPPLPLDLIPKKGQKDVYTAQNMLLHTLDGHCR